jgi:hypothetical protein
VPISKQRFFSFVNAFLICREKNTRQDQSVELPRWIYRATIPINKNVRFPMLNKYTRWDIMRLGYAALLVIYLFIVTIALISAIGQADNNLKIGYIGVGFAVIGVAFALVSSVTTDIELRKVRDFSLYHEDIRREINLQAIEFKIRLDQIDKKIENFTITKKDAAKKPRNLTLGFVLKAVLGMMGFLILMTLAEIFLFQKSSDAITIAITTGIITGLFVILFQKSFLDVE